MTPSKQDALQQTIIATPSIGAILLGWLDVPLQTWSVRAGIFFILLQTAHLIWRWRREVKQQSRRRSRNHG